MLRSLQPLFVFGVWVMAIPAAAQEPTGEPTSNDQQSVPADTAPAAAEAPSDQPATEAAAGQSAPEDPSAKATANVQASAEVSLAPATARPAPEDKPGKEPGGWQTEVHGYFRAPVTLGFSSRQDPPNNSPPTFTGPKRMQISYGPNRTFDSNYYSFAYTRLQEQDWAELFVHVRKKHVEAVVGWMGYWLQGAGYRNIDAAWLPGNAYLTLDTDVEVASFKPNIALTVGAWWPSFGAFPKYDTYTLGRFRQVGEQLKLTFPVNPDLTLTFVQGFGTGRDGSFNSSAPAPYQGQTGLDLLHYYNLSLSYQKYVDIGLHYNYEWTRDPYLFPSGATGTDFAAARDAKLEVKGAEVNLYAPYAGRLWISPSWLTVQNGWALNWGGTEVMHGIGGAGVAVNYMAYTGLVSSSSGSGNMVNLGVLYENTLSNVLGREPAAEAPEVTLNVFGLMANASLDLPAGTAVTQDEINQFKWGADLTVQALDWLGVMARYDEVNYDTDNPGFIFSAITFPRIVVSSHFLSSESIYLQYSRYRYGDKMTLVGQWPWGQDLVAGSHNVQGSPYTGLKPDEDIIKFQANVEF